MKRTRLAPLFLILVSPLLALFSTPQALAQTASEPVALGNVHLWLYPEYDDPRLLVMLEGQIAGVQAPAKVRFLVPSAAEMYSAGSIDSQGQYSGGPPQREPSPLAGWDEISYEVKTTTFRVEYYDPVIGLEPRKTISYEFRRLYPISDLTVIIQEPRKSTDFSVSPAGEPFTDSDGFASHLYHYSDLDTQRPLRFEITYTKTDPAASLYIKDSRSSNTLLIVAVTVSVGLLITGVFLWVRRSRSRTRAERRRPAAMAPVPGFKDKHLAHRFCRQCGQRLERPSRFCPYCGTALQ